MGSRPQLLASALWQETVGELYAGKPHVRFDEGGLNPAEYFCSK